MQHSDFHLGMTFWVQDRAYPWRVTDIGTRTIVAIQIDPAVSPDWYNGPPYSVLEFVMDEYDFPACGLTREGAPSLGVTGMRSVAAEEPPEEEDTTPIEQMSLL